MYYIIESQSHNLVGMIALNNRVMDGLRPAFTKGEVINSLSGQNLSLELENAPRTLPDYFEIDATPIISNKLLVEIKDYLVDTCQLFPINVQVNNRSIDEYYLINIVNKVSCVDVDKSLCNKYKSKLMRIHSLCLLDGFSCDIPIFRSREFPLAIVINAELFQTFESTSCTGFKLSAAEGWGDSERF